MTTTSSDSERMQDRLRLIEEMLITNPDDPFLHYAAALEHRKAGNTSKARVILSDLMISQPEYLGTYYQLGKILEQEGQTENAVEVYRKGKQIAEMKNDVKTLGELSEALMLLDED